jgi:hypothetical protein
MNETSKRTHKVTTCSYLMHELLNLSSQVLIVVSSDCSPLIKHGYVKTLTFMQGEGCYAARGRLFQNINHPCKKNIFTVLTLFSTHSSQFKQLCFVKQNVVFQGNY